MNLLELHEAKHDTPTYVNPESIVSVNQPDEQGFTNVTLQSGQHLIVKEEPGYILKAIGHEDKVIIEEREIL